MTPIEKKLLTLLREYMQDNNLNLEHVKTGKQKTDLPIGTRTVWMFLKEKTTLSLNQQTELIEFFGYSWDIEIKKQ
jgi:hypothetical protein